MLGFAPGGHIEAKVTFGDILGHAIVWLLLSIITVGIGLMFYPYSFAKFILNRTYLVQGGQRYRLQCDLDVMSQLGHIIGWLVLTIITVGIAYPFYLYKTWNFALNHTRVLPG